MLFFFFHDPNISDGFCPIQLQKLEIQGGNFNDCCWLYIHACCSCHTGSALVGKTAGWTECGCAPFNNVMTSGLRSAWMNQPATQPCDFLFRSIGFISQCKDFHLRLDASLWNLFVLWRLCSRKSLHHEKFFFIFIPAAAVVVDALSVFLAVRVCDPSQLMSNHSACPAALFQTINWDPKHFLQSAFSGSRYLRLVPMETTVQRVQAHCYADRSGRPKKCNQTAVLAGSDWQRFFTSSSAFWLRSGRSPRGRRWVCAKDSVAAQWIRTWPEWFRRSIIPPAWPFGALLPLPRALCKCFPASSLRAYVRLLLIYLFFFFCIIKLCFSPLLFSLGSYYPFFLKVKTRFFSRDAAVAAVAAAGREESLMLSALFIFRAALSLVLLFWREDSDSWKDQRTWTCWAPYAPSMPPLPPLFSWLLHSIWASLLWASCWRSATRLFHRHRCHIEDRMCFGSFRFLNPKQRDKVHQDPPTAA